MIETLDIKIAVQTFYLEQYSQPEKHRFAFGYTIAIENHSDENAQLLNRHWIIIDAKGKTQEVKGEGVVGKQPHIAAGKKFTYSSHAVLATHAGTMEGSYTMRTTDNSVFEVPIPIFSLTRPQALH